eukprot:6491094-Amphidinium_carterae.2
MMHYAAGCWHLPEEWHGLQRRGSIRQTKGVLRNMTSLKGGQHRTERPFSPKTTKYGSDYHVAQFWFISIFVGKTRKGENMNQNVRFFPRDFVAKFYIVIFPVN